MKKGMLFIFLMIFLMGIVNADCSGRGVHGVEILGECYDCGANDGVCPIDYGANCEVPDADCVYEEEAFWSLNGDTLIKDLEVIFPQGKEILLVVKNVGLSEGTSVDLEVIEDDFLGDDEIISLSAEVSGGKIIGTWEISEEDLELTDDYSEFYFTASSGDWEISTKDRGDIYRYLNLTVSYSGGITSCSDYQTQEACENDSESVSVDPIPDTRVDGLCTYYLKGYCGWDESNAVCEQKTNETEDADNPEECEPAKGECAYTESGRTGDCSAGDEFYTIKYTSDKEGCEDWDTGIIPCPAKVRLSFFNWFSLIVSIFLIAVIHIFMAKSRKFIK